MTVNAAILPTRMIGPILMALLALTGLPVHGQFDFTHIDIPWNEADGIEGADGGVSLSNLNSKLSIALSDPTDTTFCYLLEGTPTNALTFNASAASCSTEEGTGRRSLATDWLTLKSDEHVDYELGATQILEIVGYDADGVAQGTFEVNFTVTDADERPLLIQETMAQQRIQYWVPGESERFLIFDLFQDPDGTNVYFDSRSIATDVWICDNANAGDFEILEVPTPPARELGPGSPVTFAGGDADANCSVSNEADPSAIPPPDPSPGMRGTGGNRVVTTKRVGPYLDITADSLADDTDGDGTVTDRGIGTYAAKIYIRAWSGPSDAPLSTTEFAIVNIRVKVGANNPPQFAGASTGFAVTLTEGDDESDPMPAWIANDFDAGGGTNDFLLYGLNSAGNTSVSIPGGGGRLTLGFELGDNPATNEIETDFVVALTLVGSNLDYEKAPSPFTVNLVVTDRWSSLVSVPIQVTLIDVNELTTTKEGIDDQRLSNGLSRELDLNAYFDDPEGDEITYKAYTNLYDDVVEVDNDTDTLTIHGKHAKQGEGGESTVTVTVIATDSKGLVADLDFELVTRYENQPPSINALGNGTISLGTGIFEEDSAGTLLMPLIEYTDDDPAPKAVFNHEPLFKAIVDPYFDEEALESNEFVLCAREASGCIAQTGKVAIVVGDKNLNFEEQSLHRLSLALQDDWEPELVSKPIEFQVAVYDSNEAPTVVNSIENQAIVVHGSGSYRAGPHFTDEDRKDRDRLRVYAESSDETVVEVDVTELDLVSFNGLKQGTASITLTAYDTEGESVDLSFPVSVGPNNPPLVNQDAVASQFPPNNVLDVGEFAEIELAGLFEEPDQGDMITSIIASTSDEGILLAIPTNDGETSTLVGREAGVATLTITATDLAGNMTSVEEEITVNATPEEAVTLDPQTLDRVTPHVVDVSGVFTDADDGDESLTITAEAVGDGMDRVTLDVIGFELTIRGVMNMEPGDVEIELTATDPHGASATSSFVVSIVNVSPTVVISLQDMEMDRTSPLTLDLNGVFMDADGEMLTITAEVLDASVVEIGAVDDASMLMVTALAVGSTSIVLEAVDEEGATITVDFDITVINIAPVVAEAVPDQTTTRVNDLSIDVGATFDDPDQDNSQLSIAVSVADSAYVDASLSGSTLTIAGLDVGSTTVTLTATDADGGVAEHTFTTTIDNLAPVVATAITPLNLEVGGQPALQAMAGLFIDDGDPLTYTITSSNSEIASTSINDMTALIGPVSRGSATFTIMAADPHGGSAAVTGFVTVGDGELKAVAAKSLAGFGRALLASVSSSVGSRVMSDARSTDLSLDTWAPVERQGVIAMNMTADERRDAAWHAVQSTTNMPQASVATDYSAAHGDQTRGFDSIGSMFGQSFALNLGSTDNPSRWSVWGEIDRQSYEGTGYDGTASSFYLGADFTVEECWLFGVAIASSSGESDYAWGTAKQTMNLSLTTMLPYVSYQPGNGSLIWGVAGFGSGELDTTVVGAPNDISTLTTTIAMVGGSQNLTTAERFNLALRGDAATAILETEDGNGPADGLAADVNRVRVGLDGSFRIETGEGGVLEPFSQVSLRSDGGDGETGTGVEIAGGVRMTSNAFMLEVQGRTLALHGADEYSESGVSLMAKFNPSASVTGVVVSIAPRWGADAQGNGMLWRDSLNLGSANTYGALTGFGNTGANRSIDSQIGYGVLVANEQFLLMPFIDVGISDSDRREALVGMTLQKLVKGTTSLDVNLALGRVEQRDGDSSDEIGLNAILRF